MKRFLTLFWISTLVVGLMGCGASPNKENTILSEPPNLTIVSGSTQTAASKCSFEWDYAINETESSSTSACGANILDNKEYLNSFTPKPDSLSVTLDFEVPPDSVTALCWSTDDWGKTESEGQPISIEDLTMTLKDGAYIYQIEAEWNRPGAYEGEVEYGFYTEIPTDSSK